MIVSNVMTGNPIAITTATTVHEAAETLRRERIHCLPVVDDKGRPVGVISTRNILHAAVPAYATRELLPTMQSGPDIPSVYDALHEIRNHGVSDIMERSFALLSADTPTSAAAATLINLTGDCQNAMVVDDDGVLVGTVTALDIVARIPD